MLVWRQKSAYGNGSFGLVALSTRVPLVDTASLASIARIDAGLGAVRGLVS